MGFNFHVSLQETDKILHDWIKEMQRNNELSPSLVFRDAMLQRKAEWDAIHTENPALLHKRIDALKKTVGMQSSFITADKTRQEDWFNFFEKNGNEIKSKKKQKGGIIELIELEKVGGTVQ